MKKRIGMFAVVFALVSAAAPGADVVTVVAPEGPLPLVMAAEGEFIDPYSGGGKVHQDAAADLCYYLSRVTGRDIKLGMDNPAATVIIHVGPDAFVLEHAPEVKGLFADGFLLKHITVGDKHHIIISGIRWYSSRWAVEEFLKQFAGVRWLFPGDARYGEIVPSRPTVTIDSGLDQKHEPDYLNRSTGTDFLILDRTGKYPRLGEIHWNFGGHAFQAIFTQKDYEEHPEWFALFTISEDRANPIISKVYTASPSVLDALTRGVRRQRWHWGYGNGWQICTSNPETVQHAAEYARNYFSKRPDSPIVSMGQNDSNGWCECDLCKKFIASATPSYTVSERYWYWVNQVAREVAKTHPDKLIATLAYGASAPPPRFQLEKNIAVSVTIYNTGMLDLAERWKAKCSSVNLYSYAMGDWFIGFRHYPHAMRDFLKWGHDELNAASHTAEVHGSWSFDGPKYHYMQALMWNVDADPDKIMQDYCHDWFGAAAGPMKAFWDRLEQVYERRGHPRRLDFYTGLGWNPNPDEFDLYTLDDVVVLDKAIAGAEGKANTDADSFRVARVADAWKYYRTFLLGKLKYADKQDMVLAEAATSSGRARELARELADLQSQRASFFRLLRAYPHITTYGPQSGSHDERWGLSRVMFNRNILKENYLNNGFSYVATFSDMRTILDDLCEQTTDHLVKVKGTVPALSFWYQVKHTDPLYVSAQTQIYMINNPNRSNLLVNGDFETGTLEGWQVSGGIGVAAGISRGGGYAVRGTNITLSQSVSVGPGERYRLTVRSKHETQPNPNAVLSTDVSFKGGNNYEPNFRRLRPINPDDNGWVALRTTFTVPHVANTAVVSIKSSGTPVIFDDLTLEKIKDGPAIKPGMLMDDFSGNRINENNWVEAPAGRSGYLPAVSDGALVFDDRLMATLVSWSSFDELIRGAGDKRFRLRLHISKGTAKGQDALLECGIRPGNVAIKWDDAGVYFTHVFSVSGGENTDKLRINWYYALGHPRVASGGDCDIKPANLNDRDAWYTIYFDTENVTIYAGSSGYDETEKALVGKQKHGMANLLTAKGPVFLKLWGSNAKVHEISLMRPDMAADKPQVDGQKVDEPMDVPWLTPR